MFKFNKKELFKNMNLDFYYSILIKQNKMVFYMYTLVIMRSYKYMNTLNRNNTLPLLLKKKIYGLN